MSFWSSIKKAAGQWVGVASGNALRKQVKKLSKKVGGVGGDVLNLAGDNLTASTHPKRAFRHNVKAAKKYGVAAAGIGAGASVLSTLQGFLPGQVPGATPPFVAPGRTPVESGVEVPSTTLVLVGVGLAVALLLIVRKK